MSNYAKYSLQTDAIRTELHDELNLTGCEISCNQMPAGAAVPFVHKHKENEEVYLITQGGGEFYIDGDIISLQAGDCVRVDPSCARCLRAGPDGITYFCIQTKAGSLEHFTSSDGELCPDIKAF